MRIDRALDSGSVSMVKEYSKHQNNLVLSLTGLTNTSNKGQVSRSINSQLLKKAQCLPQQGECL